MQVIKAGYLFDGVNEEIQKDVAVFIEGAKIKEIVSLELANIPTEAKVVDHLSGWAIPGMIDCHVHLSSSGVADARTLVHDSEAALAYRAVSNAQKNLKAGFTTIRNMGSNFDVDIKLKKAIQEETLIGPHIVTSGRCIAITGGHGHSGGIEADGTEEVRKAVRTLVKAGAEVIKIMATGGVLTEGVEPGAAEFTYEELKVAAEEAHRAGRKIGTHAHGNTGIRNAVKAGIDTIEHGVFIDEEIIQMMVDKKIALVPTLSAPHNINAHGLAGGIPEYAVRKNNLIYNQHAKSFRMAYEAGVIIGLGTDSGTPFNYHGNNALELELMVQAGMKPLYALRAATSVAAEVIGLGNKKGRLKTGYDADLLLITGDPVQNISLLRDRKNIQSIYLEGRQVV